MTDKEKFIDHWIGTLGAEEAERCWEAKLAMVKRDAPMVMGDIQPYISQIDGSLINSRSRHREHLKEHKCIEVGNETQKTTAKIPTYDPALKRRIADITNAKLGY